MGGGGELYEMGKSILNSPIPKCFERKREIVAVFKTCVSVEGNVTAAREGNVSASAAVPYMYDRWPCLQRENKGNTWWRRTVA